MKFWSQKFPRQARLRSEKSLDGPRWASRQKKFLRNQKSQELFRGQVSQEPRHPTKQASWEPRCSAKCPQPRPSPYLPSMEQREFFLLIWLCLYTQYCVTGRFNGAFQFLLIQRFLGNDFRGSFAVGRGHFLHLKSFSDRIIHMCLAHAACHAVYI